MKIISWLKEKNEFRLPRWKIILIFISFLIIVVMGILYSKYQFDICYPEVSPNFWYCIQHAL